MCGARTVITLGEWAAKQGMGYRDCKACKELADG